VAPAKARRHVNINGIISRTGGAIAPDHRVGALRRTPTAYTIGSSLSHSPSSSAPATSARAARALHLRPTAVLLLSVHPEVDASVVIIFPHHAVDHHASRLVIVELQGRIKVEGLVVIIKHLTCLVRHVARRACGHGGMSARILGELRQATMVHGVRVARCDNSQDTTVICVVCIAICGVARH